MTLMTRLNSCQTMMIVACNAKQMFDKNELTTLTSRIHLQANVLIYTLLS